MAIERLNGVQYLSSNLIVQNYLQLTAPFKLSKILKRQGPSLEHQASPIVEGWGPPFDNLEGIDMVPSIHCDVWPSEASEWCQRPRHFGWPTLSNLSSIISFGCHLVAVGHPDSKTKLTEWRISFSMAERTLVWSFSHIQM